MNIISIRKRIVGMDMSMTLHVCAEVLLHVWLYDFYDTMDGRMTCDFTSFSTVFHSYQDDEQWRHMIIKNIVWAYFLISNH